MRNLLFSLFTLLLFFSQPAAAQPGTSTENVFLITFDGLRWQELFSGADPGLIAHDDYVGNADHLKEKFFDDDPMVRRQRLMPFFWSTIVEKGQIYGNHASGCRVVVTNNQWFSYPGYNEILTGKADPEIDSNSKIPNANRTVLEYLNMQSGFEGHVAAFGSWDVFPYIVNEARSGVPVNAGFESADGPMLSEREEFLNELQQEIPSPWGTVRLDAFTHHYALEYLKNNHPRVLYIAYGETDDFAHDGDYEAYLKSAHQTDAFIASLWEFAQRDPFYRGKTTFIFTTDHGRGTVPVDTWRSHGTDIEGADEIWMAFLGPDTPALGEVASCDLRQDQVASSVAAFLGLDFNSAQEAGLPVGAAFKAAFK